jgi:F-type H+-transporting ATPase subunit alpha
LKVEEQVAVIFAGTRGYLDAIPIASVQHFESELLLALRDKHKAILDGIREKKELTADLEKQLVAALDGFARGFAP